MLSPLASPLRTFAERRGSLFQTTYLTTVSVKFTQKLLGGMGLTMISIHSSSCGRFQPCE